MCPTGWFVPTPEGPLYLVDALQQVYPLGELKVTGPVAEDAAVDAGR
jgi:hypothetical protein